MRRNRRLLLFVIFTFLVLPFWAQKITLKQRLKGAFMPDITEDLCNFGPGYLAASGYAGLQWINPETGAVEAVYKTKDYFFAVADIDGRYAYALTSAPALLVIDFKNKSKPKLVRTLKLKQASEKILVRPKSLVLYSDETPLTVVDTSKPTSPKLINNTEKLLFTRVFDFAGLVLARKDTGLFRVDLSKPSKPVAKLLIELPPASSNCFSLEGDLYLTLSNNMPMKVELTDSSASLVSAGLPPKSQWAFEISGTSYILTVDGRIMTRFGSVWKDLVLKAPFLGMKTLVTGESLVFYHTNTDIYVYSFADKLAPAPVARIARNVLWTALTQTADILVAGSSREISAYTLNGKLQPSFIGSIAVDQTPIELHLNGDRLIAVSEKSLGVYSFDREEGFNLLSSLPLPQKVYKCLVIDNDIYAAAGSAGLIHYSVLPDGNLWEKTRYAEKKADVSDAVTAADKVYSMDSNRAIFVFDRDDEGKLVQTQRIDVPGGIDSAVVNPDGSIYIKRRFADPLLFSRNELSEAELPDNDLPRYDGDFMFYRKDGKRMICRTAKPFIQPAELPPYLYAARYGSWLYLYDKDGLDIIELK